MTFPLVIQSKRTFFCECGTIMNAPAVAKLMRCPCCSRICTVPRKEGSVLILSEELPPVQGHRYFGCEEPAPRYLWDGVLPLVTASLLALAGLVETGLLAALTRRGSAALTWAEPITLAISLAAAYYVLSGSTAARRTLVASLVIWQVGLFVAVAMTGGHLLAWMLMALHAAAIAPFLTRAAADYAPGHSMPAVVTWAVGAPAAAAGLLGALLTLLL